MGWSFGRLSIMMVLISLWAFSGSVARADAPSDKPTNYVFTLDALNKTLGALGDLRAKNLPIKIGDGKVDDEIANLQKQPNIESIVTNRGLSLREFVLTYKATAQIREAEKARDNWQRILQDPTAAPEAKLDATQKLADSLKNNLFTPEQIELVRRKMPDLETLLAPAK
jgi:hypothetical protein